MKLSDIYNSICIDSSVENKNRILLKIVFYLLDARRGTVISSPNHVLSRCCGRACFTSQEIFTASERAMVRVK